MSWTRGTQIDGFTDEKRNYSFVEAEKDKRLIIEARPLDNYGNKQLTICISTINGNIDGILRVNNRDSKPFSNAHCIYSCNIGGLGNKLRVTFEERHDNPRVARQYYTWDTTGWEEEAVWLLDVPEEFAAAAVFRLKHPELDIVAPVGMLHKLEKSMYSITKACLQTFVPGGTVISTHDETPARNYFDFSIGQRIEGKNVA